MTVSGGGVFLIDDHRVFAETLALAVSTQPDLSCTGVAHSVREARSVLHGRPAEELPDLAIIDLDLPDGSGLHLIAELAQHIPVLVLTAHPRVDVLRRAKAARAAGVLGKDQPLHEILAAARTALAGGPVQSWAPGPAVHLTGRELDVLSGLGRGRDATRIAADLGISIYTTRDHIRALLAKLGAHSQLEAVVTADRLGLIAVGART
ncbi:response regulator transcription factor [Pseudonocardia sp. MH-G8]|uniref:response regulator transcription factor n=1 Tax=Pseudonocardia sp. MH-G8 TaxID=1854588 RepID=UPI000BA127AA|nr:response regulator transcription factor [Pseudonocardia sp. MH-G8]OZM79937.1 DNA-binding response regulator [Pseudonocardia sp. MH-G8]